MHRRREVFEDQYRNRRVLITGHTGFKGSWLSEWLVKLGAEVTGFSIGLPYSPCHFEVLNLRERMKHFEGDIRHLPDFVSALERFKPEIVFHLAAQSLVRRSYKEPKLTMETNAIGTLNILEAIRNAPSVKATVLVTSDKCYQNNGSNFGYRETDPLGGKDPYSSSKACAELIAHSYIQSFFKDDSSVKISTARGGNVIGGGDWAEDRIVTDCVQAWSQGKPAIIRNPEHTRPWQHVLEPLSGYLLLGKCLLKKDPQVFGEAFNFGPSPGSDQSVLALVTEMKRSWDAVTWEISRNDSRAAPESERLEINCDKALNRMQWRPTLTYDESVRLTVEWYKDFYSDRSKGRDTTQTQIEFYETKATEKGLPWAKNL